MKFTLIVSLLFVCAFTALTAPDETGSSVVLVYNQHVAESKKVAEHYAAMRHVPPNQIFGFDLTADESMSRHDFREELQHPLLAKLAANNLYGPKVSASPIRYLVLCYGVPLKISEDSSIHETIPASMPVQLQRNDAAVDNELACLPLLDHGMMLTGPMTNSAYGVTNADLLNPAHGLFMVARLDGPTPEIANALVDKALEAETNGLWGRAYFDTRGLASNDVSHLGDQWIQNAYYVCKSVGIESTLDQNPGTFPASAPLSHIALYAGWYDENVSGPFAKPTVEFMPGAFAYHLHSFSAATIRSKNRQWVGPLLTRGVTCTMGTVNEPFLGGTPNIGVFFGCWIFYGFTFGEAAYSCQAHLSWQTTVVGDPLYRPFGPQRNAVIADLKRRNSPLLDWYYLQLVNVNLARGVPESQLSLAMQQLDRAPQSSILQEKLAEFDLNEGKPTSSEETLRKALKLENTPNDRVRLMLTLAKQLADMGKEAQAFAIYQEFTEKFPDYSDMLSIDRNCLALAEKLKRPQDIDFYQKEVRRLSPGG